MEILGIQHGLTLASQTIREQITATGWEVRKVKFDTKLDRYTATAKSARGEELERNGKTERLALANLLLAVTKRTGHTHLGRWQTNFTDQLQAIAEAYSKAPLYDVKASAAFMELARDSERRADVLSEHLQIQVINGPEPYKSADKLHDDVKKKRMLVVSRVGAMDHPLWNEKQVIAYRIVHDVLGYVAADAGWDWAGENLAFAAHAHLIPVEAQKALFSESVALAAYAAHYQAYAPQKVALFPQFMNKAQEKENPHKGYPGVHPSQSYPPVPLPAAKHLVEGSLGAFGADDLRGLERLSATGTGTIDPSFTDPNEKYQSGFEDAPITTPSGQSLAQAYGDPIQASETMTNANRINTNKAPSTNGKEWSELNQEDPGQLATMKTAIVNAFRVVLLSPRKDLRWNAVHYQDIAHVPANESNPGVYWDTLEKARQEWNEARGYDRFSHIPYIKQMPALVNVMYQLHYMDGYDSALTRAKTLVQTWLTEEQNKLMREDEEKPESKRRQTFQIEAKANYQLAKRIKNYLAEHKPNLDHAITKQVKWQQRDEPLDSGEFRMTAEADWLDEDAGSKPADRTKYGAFMGGHLKAVAKISQSTDQLLQAALEDVHEHDGTGHHFRAAVLQLNLPGVGPKVCSFAWLLLQPMTSELATIDTHIMDVLGHNEKEMNNRDYFGMERELKAGRDAAGYSQVPLGQFQWGMWDYKRTGPGSHQDHSPMAVLDPAPHTDIDWAAKEQPINAEQAQAWKENWRQNPPEWWAATQPARQQAWDDYQQNEAKSVGKAKVPYGSLPDDYDTDVYTSSLKRSDEAFTAELPLTPWYMHPQTGQKVVGQPDQSIMAHARQTMGLDVPGIWALLGDAGVGKS